MIMLILAGLKVLHIKGSKHAFHKPKERNKRNVLKYIQQFIDKCVEKYKCVVNYVIKAMQNTNTGFTVLSE